MDTFSDEVTGLTLRPNRQAVEVWFPARGGRERWYELTPATAIFQAGAAMRLADLPEWFMGSEDTVYTTVFCDLEYEGSRVAVAKFDRK